MGSFATVVAIVSFIGTILTILIAMVKPLLKLNTAITKLTVAIENTDKRLAERIVHDDKVDKILDDHEKRILTVELRHEQG